MTPKVKNRNVVRKYAATDSPSSPVSPQTLRKFLTSEAESCCANFKMMAFYFVSSLCILIASIVVGVLLQGETSDVAPEFSYVGFLPPNYSQPDLEKLKGKVLLNMDEVAASVNFSNFHSNPYPTTLGYDTKIDTSVNCYVEFASAANRSAYSLHSITSDEAAARNESGTFHLTHENHCGVCSSLDDLALYLEKPDMTSPVRKCGMRVLMSRAVSCLQGLGFSEACSYIWFWNTRSTRKSCLGTCLRYITAPNNMYSKGVSHCRPDLCPNTINGEPACHETSWRKSYFRLNPCIACDECRSGGVFKRVAGRTRRASGAPSAIRRDPRLVYPVTHFYG